MNTAETQRPREAANQHANTSNLPKNIEKMPPNQRAKVVETVSKDSRFDRFLARTASISGAAWSGWEKGVNGSLRSTWEGLESAGQFIGESAAMAVHGKDGEFVQHAIEKTEWIRKGLDATGEFIGVSAAKMVQSGAEETLRQAGSFAADQTVNLYRKAKGALEGGSKMTAEEIAYNTTHLAGGIAVGVATGYALRGAQTAKILGTEISLGTSATSKLANQAVSKAAQLGVEFAGGTYTSKGQETIKQVHKKYREAASVLENLEKEHEMLEAAFKVTKMKFRKGVQDEPNIAEARRLNAAIKESAKKLERQKGVIEAFGEIGKTLVVNGIEKGGMVRTKEALNQNSHEEKQKAKQEALGTVKQKGEKAANEPRYAPAQEQSAHLRHGQAHHRTELSGKGSNTIEHGAHFTARQQEIARQLASKELTPAGLTKIQAEIKAQYQAMRAELEGFRSLASGLAPVGSRDRSQNADIGRVRDSIRILETEIAALETFSKSHEMANAERKLRKRAA